MAIIGHGIDIVDVPEIENLLSLSNDFLMRCFTAREQAILEEISASPERIAARFAGKEAVLKALGIGFGSGASFLDIEVLNQASGAPCVILHDRVKRVSDDQGIRSWFISLSHEGGKAIASAIATD